MSNSCRKKYNWKISAQSSFPATLLNPLSAKPTKWSNSLKMAKADELFEFFLTIL